MTNPALDFKIQRRISQILAWFLNSNAGNPKSRVGRRRRHRGALRLRKTHEERPAHGHAIGLLNSPPKDEVPTHSRCTARFHRSNPNLTTVIHGLSAYSILTQRIPHLGHVPHHFGLIEFGGSSFLFESTNHPVCAAKEASRHLFYGAATPPLKGGDWVGSETGPFPSVFKERWLRDQ